MGWKPTPSWAKGSPWWLFRQTHLRLGNDSAQPSTQWASSIWSIHSKYYPSRALVNGFCLLNTNIIAFRNSSQSSSFASLSSSHRHTRRNTPQTMRVWCVVRGRGSVLVVGAWGYVLIVLVRSCELSKGLGFILHKTSSILPVNMNHHHPPHDTTIIATLPHNANTRYPPHRHTILNEQQWEENWVKTGLHSSRLTNFSLVQQQAKLNKNR